MPEEFENVIMSKFPNMPTTLIFEERYMEITDMQFAQIKGYIKILVGGEKKGDRTMQCGSCGEIYREQTIDKIHTACPECQAGMLHDVTLGHV